MERVVTSPDFVAGSTNESQDENPGVGYLLKLENGPKELVRALDIHGAAVEIMWRVSKEQQDLRNAQSKSQQFISAHITEF